MFEDERVVYALTVGTIGSAGLFLPLPKWRGMFGLIGGGAWSWGVRRLWQGVKTPCLTRWEIRATGAACCAPTRDSG